MANIDPFSAAFKGNGLWQRLLEYVNGDMKRAELWWTTPLPYEPFNFRTPLDLMNTDEWDKVRIHLESKNMASQATYDYGPMTYYNTKRDGVVWQRQPRQQYKIKTKKNRY